MIIKEEDTTLMHYGTKRHSGRYPWGSGGQVTARRSKTFLDNIKSLRQQGLSDPEIAKGFGMTTTEFRAHNSIAKNAAKAADIAMAQRLHDKGNSNIAIGKRMGRNESYVRTLLAAGQQDKNNQLVNVANMLRDEVGKKEYIQIGSGVEHQLNMSKDRLATAVEMLRAEGYMVHKVQINQLGTAAGKLTYVKVLTPPGTKYSDVSQNKDKIQLITPYSKDGGRTLLNILPPMSVDSSRVAIRYAEDGGREADGVIFVRPGVPDVSMGRSPYAQVRIAIDGTHYLKGMAVYRDDLPRGVDLQFNTNKPRGTAKQDVMKPMKRLPNGKVDPDNPFGATIRRQLLDDSGKKVTSSMNILNEQGDWETWSHNLSSQFLSKQSPKLAKSQLDMTYEKSKAELDQIMRLTNPAVKRKLLEDYADGADFSAVHLAAAALPKTRNHVILPMDSLKQNEIYAPNYRNGERVVLIRHPHGGVFEIPELVVNNNHRPAIKLLGRPTDAVAIHSNVAKKLSGADFDGDTVLVIPNSHNLVKTAPSLHGLLDFDARAAYPQYPGMKVMTAPQKAFEMGTVSNLITDMTIKRANNVELAAAIRHSMVVIDAENHKLNYKQSAIDNGIAHLRKKYQSPKNPGASTLISKATSRQDVLARKPRSPIDGGPVDPRTGKKVFVNTGESWQGPTGKTVFRKVRSQKLVEADDAHTLSSGTLIEKVYADHSNKLKALGNEARKAALQTRPIPYDPSAKRVYHKEVERLASALTLAQRNAPLERQAQLIANTTVAAKKAANPNMGPDDVKKVSFQALEAARTRTGAKKQQIVISDDEWKAIQAGAITNTRLTEILRHADVDRVKELATPRVNTVMTSTKQRRAEAMLLSGYTLSEVADQLGVALSTLKSSISREEG